MTESQELQRSQDGDPEAFRHLVDRHQDVLFRTATLMTGSQSLAEVQVRKALRAAWHGLQAAGWGSPVKPWLIRMLVRQETDRDRPSTPAGRPLSRARLRQLPPPLDPDETDLQRQQVRRAFGSLGPADRHALVLCYFADLSDAQLASVLGVPGGAAETIRQRALHRMRSCLQSIGAYEVNGAGPFASDQALIAALRDYFTSATAALSAPADLWEVLESRAPRRPCVARIRRKVLAMAQRFWTPLAATGGAAALASAVVCAATACGPGGGPIESRIEAVALAPAATAAPASAAMAAPAHISGTVVKEVPVERVVEKSMTAPPATASSAPRHQYRPADLTAGEVNDNEKWTEYLRYRDSYRGLPVHNVDVSERYTITVRDPLGRPVPDAKVSVTSGETLIFEGRTYANGQTLFFPRAFPEASNATTFRLDVEKDGVTRSLAAERDQESEWVVNLDVDRAFGVRTPLDVLFLLDATGSMADEIGQIKSTLVSISERIGDLPSRPDLRFGMVTYRDRGDDFVTRLYDFNADVPAFASTIRDVVADGGGDTPESLNEAFHVAVHEPSWRLDDAIRLVILVADASPHLDYAQDYDYADEMIEANRRGMKIFTIASSGLDKQGEYIFRQLAQHTMGRFAFILYGGETSHSVSDYSVEQLDDLVVRLVREELDHLKAG